jgi:hypothetical protein
MWMISKNIRSIRRKISYLEYIISGESKPRFVALELAFLNLQSAHFLRVS